MSYQIPLLDRQRHRQSIRGRSLSPYKEEIFKTTKVELYNKVVDIPSTNSLLVKTKLSQGNRKGEIRDTEGR